MKRTTITILSLLLVASALGVTLFTQVKIANAEVAAGNRAFAAKDYETALKHYSVAQSQAPGQAEPLYNSANVFYQQQALDKAQQSLEQSLAQPHESIEAFIHFNLGNVAYQAKQFDASISQFESALRIDPADQAAKYNLELAIKQQQDQQKQQQDQKKEQQSEQYKKNQQGQQDQQQNQQGQQGQQDQQQNQQGQQGQQDQQQNQQGQQQNQQGQSAQPQNSQPGQPDGQVAGRQPQQGLTQEQARQLLAAIAGNSKTLLQQLQMYYFIPGSTPDKDW